MHNIVTNDKFILVDNIIERIKLISIYQDIDMNTTFSLDINNNTNDTINIYTKDLINKTFNIVDMKCEIKSNVKFFKFSGPSLHKILKIDPKHLAALQIFTLIIKWLHL